MEVPGAVRRIAVQHTADEFLILEHEFLVNAVGRIGEHNGIRGVVTVEIAGREQIYSGDFEFSRGDRSGVALRAIFGEMIRDHARHFEQRCNQPVRGAAVVHALADRIDARIESL